MAHLKRSPEFLIQIGGLIQKVLNQTLDAQDRADLARILTFNTTDSRCMVNVKEDEAIFLLRAQDIDSDKCVDRWCELQIERSIGVKDPRPLTKVADARDCAREMRAFHHRKEAD